MSKLSKRHFWEWFKRHQQEYLTLNKKPKKEIRYWLQEMNAHVRAYYKCFGFSLVLPDNGTARLTITVKGNPKHFKKADAFVATAPAIPGWSIHALEDPMPLDYILERQLEVAGIDPWEFQFSIASDDPEDTVVVMYHPLYTEGNRRIFLETAYETVYHLLGERSFGMDINHVEVDNLSCADPDEVYSLEELGIHVGRRSSSMVVDHHGTLMSMH